MARNLVGAAIAAALVLGAGPAAAQRQVALGADSTAKKTATAEPAADSLAKPGADVLRETFAYGGGARDPFSSLIKVANAGPELGDLQLVGVYLNVRAPEASVAVVREKTKEGKRHKLRAGDQLGRLRVTAIRPKDVIFTVHDFGFERQETLSLRKQEDVTP